MYKIKSRNFLDNTLVIGIIIRKHQIKLDELIKYGCIAKMNNEFQKHYHNYYQKINRELTFQKFVLV